MNYDLIIRSSTVQLSASRCPWPWWIWGDWRLHYQCHIPNRPSTVSIQYATEVIRVAYPGIWDQRHQYRACFWRRRCSTITVSVDLMLQSTGGSIVRAVIVAINILTQRADLMLARMGATEQVNAMVGVCEMWMHMVLVVDARWQNGKKDEKRARGDPFFKFYTRNRF